MGRNSFTARSASSESYNGSAGWCFDQPNSLAWRASSIIRWALSDSTIAARSAVPSVVNTGPRHPLRTSTGR